MAGSSGWQRGGRRKGEKQARLITALDHELRRTILRAFDDSAEPLSPARIARQLRRPLSNASYHIGVLSQLGAVTEVSRGEARGARQHFYTSALADNPPIRTLLEQTREADEAKGTDESPGQRKPKRRR
jgi:DNA-binding transcriptional ArsR family regulator